MKKIVFILLFAFLLSSDYSDKYYKSMDRALDIFNSSETEQDYIKASNYFYRISQAVQTDWISSYYYALCNTRISIFQDDNDIKEFYLDKAFDMAFKSVERRFKPFFICNTSAVSIISCVVAPQ